jgi:Secretion system C-terminal sorting domain
MKKILLSLVAILTATTFYSQIINQTNTWPDVNWTLSGNYNPVNLLFNPTMGDSQFKFDDAQVSNVGDKIYLESPTLDLSTAFTAGEKALIITIDLSFALTASSSETLGLQYWDADANAGAGAWVLMPDGQPGAGDSQGTYTTCTSPGAFPIYFDFKNFTTNQQQNFKYRFFYDDGGLATGKGLCLAAPTVTSANISCAAPTALQTVNIGDTYAQIGWTANNSEVQWGVEYGAAGFTLGAGTSDTTDRNPHGLNGLTASTSYDFYVRANCIPDMAGGAVYSDWSSKINFTTASSCVAPNGGNSVKVSPTTAEIAWAPQGSESSWKVEYGFVGYTRGSGAIASFVSTVSNSNPITGLAPSTSYDFYVQADCGGGTASSWAGPYNFTTTAYTIGWLDLQWPETGAINAGDSFNVFAQIWVDELTNLAGQAPDITAWIGYNTANTDPSTWPNTNWFIATYNQDQGNNDEYQLDLGAKLTTAGTYYYASRFQLNRGAYQYGGFQGPWQMGVNDSGVLTVTGTLGIKDQIIEGFGFYPNPTKDNILLNAKQNIDQIELYNLLGQQVMIAQPGVSSYKLNLSSLNTGVYFMKVKVADKTGTYKVVRQ